MARWCVLTGFPPDVYLSLTFRQVIAFSEAAREQRSKG